MQKNELLKKIKHLLISNSLELHTAESCTGGLVSSYLTDISGASEFIFSNFVTYSNAAKEKYLGVSHKTLQMFGAVSEKTAYEMIEGLLKLSSNKGCAIATTGILGPNGGSKEKPVGLVYIGLGFKNEIKVIKYISKKPARNSIKIDITKQALLEFLTFLQNKLNPL